MLGFRITRLSLPACQFSEFVRVQTEPAFPEFSFSSISDHPILATGVSKHTETMSNFQSVSLLQLRFPRTLPPACRFFLSKELLFFHCVHPMHPNLVIDVSIDFVCERIKSTSTTTLFEWMHEQLKSGVWNLSCPHTSCSFSDCVQLHFSNRF